MQLEVQTLADQGARKLEVWLLTDGEETYYMKAFDDPSGPDVPLSFGGAVVGPERQPSDQWRV